ncbi:LysR family transcriptional regulator [Neorhizobium galegae]|uniref:LysR family transcriptional regulator n=1 Tax=Neorhizobium galegae TaxID=399 RepID=UPI0021081308|nr:LysR family transcriptional regulator [Neorhizobium galegae]UIY28295.1 LysR family transcriptional regulator [Neorhizobium galegae]
MYANINPSIDVRLLRTTYLLLRERNVSKVAVLLGHSQPAVSACLKKAREIFSDPLLVRSGQKLVLTERGEEVMTSIAAMLEGLLDTLNRSSQFDPGMVHSRMRIAAVNCFGTFLIPPIATSIRREAPGISVDFFAPSEQSDLIEDLGSGRVDMVIGNWPAPQQSLKSSTLLHCDIACVVQKSNPLAKRGRLLLEDYLDADHVSPTPGSNAVYSPIDGRLAQLGMRRHIAMSVPEYALIPAILAETDLIFTTARPYAEYIVANAPTDHLQLVEAPREFDQMNLYLLWHERAHNSGANRWLRNVIRTVARRFDQTLHPLPSGIALRAVS